MIVRKIEKGRRLRFRTPLALNDNEPPKLIKVKASILVAMATWASIPKLIITGTVTSEVLPVTTLTTLVRKKTKISVISFAAGTRQSYQARTA
jgi:hypothetical protein